MAKRFVIFLKSMSPIIQYSFGLFRVPLMFNFSPLNSGQRITAKNGWQRITDIIGRMTVYMNGTVKRNIGVIFVGSIR